MDKQPPAEPRCVHSLVRQLSTITLVPSLGPHPLPLTVEDHREMVGLQENVGKCADCYVAMA
jgi:hypothetical protein